MIVPTTMFSFLFAEVRCSIFNTIEPDVELSVYLIDHSSGEKKPLSFSFLSSKNLGEPPKCNSHPWL